MTVLKMANQQVFAIKFLGSLKKLNLGFSGCCVVQKKFNGKDENTLRNTALEKIGSGVTAGVAIPVSAPFALSDFISSDLMQLIFKLGK